MPVVTNARGGKQEAIPGGMFELLEAQAIRVLTEVLTAGYQKYGRDNWRLIPEADHTRYAFWHLLLHWSGDAEEDHLAHAFTRMMMAVAQRESSEYAPTAPDVRDADNSFGLSPAYLRLAHSLSQPGLSG